jgi:tetratricopeptide (TPR) repeat protein
MAKETDQLSNLSASAFASFARAEELAARPNNSGLDDSILNYVQCLNEAPGFSLGYAKLAIAYTRKYRLFRDSAVLNLARQNAQKAADDASSPMGLLSRGLVALYLGMTTDALTYFASALKVDPGNPDVLLYRAQAFRDLNLFRQAKYKAAAEAFDAAAEAAPNVAMPLANLGTMYIALGKNPEARDASELSLKRSPNVTAYMNLGDLAFGDKDYKGALADYQQAANLEPKRHGIWRDIGDCYSMLGQASLVKQNYAKAADLLSDAMKDNPRSGGGWMTLAFYHAKAGDRIAAETDIVNAEQRGATDVHSQFMKVQALAVLGRKADATKLLLTCMDRGLSPVEVNLAVDLNDIRKDPVYLSRISKKPA